MSAGGPDLGSPSCDTPERAGTGDATRASPFSRVGSSTGPKRTLAPLRGDRGYHATRFGFIVWRPGWASAGIGGIMLPGLPISMPARMWAHGHRESARDVESTFQTPESARSAAGV